MAAPNSKIARLGLPPLIAPPHLRGPMSRHSPEELRLERRQWAVNAGRIGYASTDVAQALGIAQTPAYQMMRKGGWDPWAHLRQRNRDTTGSEPPS